MKIKFSFLLIVIFFGITVSDTMAQCPFTPTINEGDTIICSNDTISISTQNYDTLLWYHDGIALPGQIGTSVLVHEFGYYSVEVTLNGCTERSDSILIDTWVFASPLVSHPTESDFCVGDSVILEWAGGPIGDYLWWNGLDSIPGSHDSIYKATEDGSYHLSVFPSECPNIILYSGIGVDLNFHRPEPEITRQNTFLMTDPAVGYQWYKDGTLISATGSSINAATYGAGTYRVEVTDSFGCSGFSDPFLYPPVGISTPATTTDCFIINHNNSGNINVSCGLNSNIHNVEVFDLLGKKIGVKQIGAKEYTLENNPVPGIYLIKLTAGDETIVKRIIIK